MTAVDRRHERNKRELQRALIDSARNADDDLLTANRSLPTLLLLAFVAAVADGVAKAVAGGTIQIDEAA